MASLGNSQSAIHPNEGDPARTEPGDVLSPTDGYFHSLPPQPEAEYVPDPEQVNTTAAKEIEAREAQEERERRRASRRAENIDRPRPQQRDVSPAASSIVSASSGRSVDTTAAPDDGVGPAPRPALPSYDDAIAERPYQGRSLIPNQPRSYDTMGDLNNATSMSDRTVSGRRDVESAPLLQTTDPNDGDDSWRGWWRRKRRAWNKKHRHNHLARKLFVVLIFVCGMAFAIKLIAFIEPEHLQPSHPEHSTNPVPPSTKTALPPTIPSATEPAVVPIPTKTVKLPGPSGSSQPRPPNKPSEPTDRPDLTHGRIKQAATKFCKSESVLNNKSFMTWDFGAPNKFEFTQTSNAGFALQSLLRTGGRSGIDPADYSGDDQSDSDKRRRIRHVGQVIIERKEKGSGVSIQVGGYYSHPFLAHQTGFAADGSSILLQVPRTVIGEHDGNSDDLCIYSFAIIQVAPSHNLTTLKVNAEVMSISVEDTLDLGAGTKSIALQTYLGAVNFPPPEADISKIRNRDLRVETSAGQITGAFPLYDSLTLISRAGAIDVSIDPREADREDVKPAQLSVEAAAGLVKLDTLHLDQSIHSSKSHLPGRWPPRRDYRTKIVAQAGLMDVRLLHGTITEIFSQTGKIKVFLVPCDDPTQDSRIDIAAQSSLISLDVANSIRSPRAPLQHLSAKVKSTVGSQSIGLPSSWEGKLHGSSLSGSSKITLTDFVADRSGRQPNNPLWFSIDGHRGDGEGLIESETISGSIEWADTRYP